MLHCTVVVAVVYSCCSCCLLFLFLFVVVLCFVHVSTVGGVFLFTVLIIAIIVPGKLSHNYKKS